MADDDSGLPDDSGAGSQFGALLGDAVTWATPFAKSVLTDVTTQSGLAGERVANNFLNGSGAVDNSLAKTQAPQSQTDFLTGQRNGLGGTIAATLKLPGAQGQHVFMLGIVLLVVVVLLLRNK